LNTSDKNTWSSIGSRMRKNNYSIRMNMIDEQTDLCSMHV